MPQTADEDRVNQPEVEATAFVHGFTKTIRFATAVRTGSVLHEIRGEELLDAMNTGQAATTWPAQNRGGLFNLALGPPTQAAFLTRSQFA